jgi:hypothetical protein
MNRFVVLFAIGLLAQTAQSQNNSSAQPEPDTSQMSLAERAAAARKATQAAHAQASTNPNTPSPNTAPPNTPPPLTPEQRGSVRGNQYINDFLHFRIDLGNEWEPLGAERVAASTAAARKYFDPGNGSSFRVLWIGDSSGRTIILSIVALPPDLPTDIDELAVGFKRIARAQLARANDLQDASEPMLLGNANHKFSAFRLSGNVQNKQIVQSVQLTRSNGFLLLFTVTGRSDEEVTRAVRFLNSSLAWPGAPQ